MSRLVELGQERILLPGFWEVTITADGEIPSPPDFVAHTDEEDVVQMVLGHYGAYLYPVYLTLALMNCRNVRTTDVAATPKLSRAHQRRHGRPLVRYKTLVIEGMRELLAEVYAGGTGVERALHTRRGHPKTFTSERPLFGQHVGTFFWGPRLVGSKKQGLVVKDYEVKPLRETPPSP